MNERLTSRGLAKLLSEQTDMDGKKAESLIDALSSYISNALELNGVVKITGLGTFKIVRVSERESVHIKTGERFVIPSHHKISFIPDKYFKERINQPFSVYEPMEMNDDAQIANIDEPAEAESEKTYSPPLPDEISEQERIESSEVSEYETENDDSASSPEMPPIVVVDDENQEPEYSEKESDTIDDNIENGDDAAEEESVSNSDDYAEFAGEETNEPPLSDDDDTDGFIARDEETTAEEPQDDENEEYSADDDNESEEEIAEEKPEKERRYVKVPLWMFIFVPLLVFLAVCIATFVFLQYTSENRSHKTEITSVEIPPVPIGAVYPSDTTNSILEDYDSTFENPEIIAEIVEETNETDTTTQVSDSVRNERPAIDWLAPSPSEKESSRTKRADRPNSKIERDNAGLRVQKTSDANASKQTNKTDKTDKAEKQEKQEKSKSSIPARVRMTAGSSLTQIAMEHYGDKIFWVYIYDYNRDNIKNFDNIPVGTELRLPPPKRYGIDAKSKSSIEKARQKQAQLMKWDRWDDYQ